MYRHATSLVLFVVALFLISPSGIAQQPSHPAGEEAQIKKIVDAIMQPYLAQNGAPGAIVGVSLHGHRYYFPYGKATDEGAPFTPDTLVEIGSCTKTFTTTLFALAINRNEIVPDASAQKYMPKGYTLQAQQLTPLELADFTSGMPDDPTNLPRLLERRR